MITTGIYRIQLHSFLCAAIILLFISSLPCHQLSLDSQHFEMIGSRLNCNNVTGVMDLFNHQIFNNDLFPNNFQCNSVVLPNVFQVGLWNYFSSSQDTKVLKYLTIQAKGKEETNICKKVEKWERLIGISCAHLLCENKQTDFSGFISNITNNETKVHEWINYCQYCANETIRDYEKLNNRFCSPADPNAKQVILSFPTSVYYCGLQAFGIPFLIEKSQLPQIDIVHDYSLLCYCPAMERFGLRCDPFDDMIGITSTTSTITILSLYVLVFLGISLVTFIPKLVASIKKRKLSNILPILFVELALVMDITSFIVTLTIGQTIWSTFLSTIGLLFTIISLFSWIISWYRIVQFAKTRTQPRTFIWYLLLLSLLLLIAVAYVVIGVVVDNNLKWVGVYSMVLTVVVGLLTVTSLVLSSIWIYRAMKKISDVNILQTTVGSVLITTETFEQFLRFIVFASSVVLVLLAMFGLLIYLGFFSDNFNMFFISALCGFFTSVVGQLLMTALAYMEFDKLDFMETYCWCLRRKAAPQGDLYVSLYGTDSTNTTE